MSDISEQRDQIIEQLEDLNKKLRVQNSIRHLFLRGIVYGIGFFVGSAVLATILFGILSPWIGEIDWIQEMFQRGREAL